MMREWCELRRVDRENVGGTPTLPSMMRVVLVISLAVVGVVRGQDLFQSDPPSVGGVLFPHLHANAALGDSTRDPADLAAHGHDPNDQFTLQGVDLGASLRIGDYLRGFANYRVFRDLDDEWDGELPVN